MSSPPPEKGDPPPPKKKQNKENKKIGSISAESLPALKTISFSSLIIHLTFYRPGFINQIYQLISSIFSLNFAKLVPP